MGAPELPENDPTRTSWVPVDDDSDFPIQNLPFGAVRVGDRTICAVAIGEHALDLARAVQLGRLGLPAPLADTVTAPNLDRLLAAGPDAWRAVRAAVSALLTSGSSAEADADRLLIPLRDTVPALPFTVADFTDFFSNRHHAERSAALMRGGPTPLPPNWRHLPVGYHGRSATVVPSGTPVRRPVGQVGTDAGPATRPTDALDFELEVGAVVGVPNTLGTPIGVDDFDRHVFGLVLLNDWSARDLQRWESAPLGPLLSKSFATTCGPWVVTLDALRPYRVGPAQAPDLQPYLRAGQPWGYDVDLTVRLRTAHDRQGGADGAVITRVGFADMHFTAAQQLAHLTLNGAAVRTGDLYGSGTVSGPDEGSEGCLLERTRLGTVPLRLADGQTRSWLEDGDEVVLTGSAGGRDGRPRIGFGEATGFVVPGARPPGEST